MTTSIEQNPVDQPAAMSAVIAISIIGLLFFLGMPIIMGALAEQVGYSERQIGWFSTAEFGAVGLASLMASALIVRLNRRTILLFGLAATAAGCALSLVVIEHFNLIIWTRLLAGFGGGLCYAVGMSILAGSSNTARTFSILMFSQGVVSSIELLTLPWLVELSGVGGIFVMISCLSLAGMILVQWVPIQSGVQADDDVHSSAGKGVTLAASCCLLSVFMYCVMVGTIWTFIERVGVSLGKSTEYIAAFLSLANLLNLAGCLIAYRIAKRFGISTPLALSLSIMTFAMFAMGNSLSLFSYLLGTSTFFLLWALTDIYQSSALSNLDHSGRFTALVPAAQSLGITAGPALSALLFGQQADYQLLLNFCGLYLALALALYAVVHISHRRAVDNNDNQSAPNAEQPTS